MSEKIERYYNVEKTDNPYIIKYIETEIETLSDNFKICDKPLYSIPGCIHAGPVEGIIIDEEVLKEILHSYKEQLLENKNKNIVDTYLLKDSCPMALRRFPADCIDVFGHYLIEYGLSISKEGEISLKKLRKPKPEKPTLPKHILHYRFRFSIEEYLKLKLGIRLKVFITSKSLYSIIMMVKALCPNATYNDLFSYEGYRHEECEAIWNNPELAKQKPTPKKEKK